MPVEGEGAVQPGFDSAGQSLNESRHRSKRRFRGPSLAGVFAPQTPDEPTRRALALEQAAYYPPESSTTFRSQSVIWSAPRDPNE